MSTIEKLEAIREYFIKKLGATERRWRMRRSEIVGHFRYQIIEALYKAGEPLTHYQVAYIFNKGLQSVKDHLRVLEFNDVVCTKITPTLEPSNFKYYTICPVCPVKDECQKPQQFWVKSGLMEAEKSPSQRFFEGTEN